MTFRGRLIVAVTLLTALSLGGAFAAVSYAVERSQERQLDDALRAEAIEEATESAGAGGSTLVISDRPGPAANDVGPLTKYAAIYGPDGQVMTSTATFGGSPPAVTDLPPRANRCFDLWAGPEHLRGVWVPVPGQPGHKLLLAAPRTDLDGDDRFLSHAMIAAFIVALAWAALLATWIVRRLTQAHARLAEVVRRVADGDLEARVGTTGNDPETSRLARDIDEMIEKLGRLLASQREFIASAAHELRSPLTALYGELSHALRRPRDAEDYRSAIEEALDATRRLKTLAEDLLALARVDVAGESTAAVDVAEAAAAAVRTVQTAAAERSVRVETAGTGGFVRGHSPDIERIYRNVIENAVAHSPEGHAVRIKLEREPQRVLLFVEDDGEGVCDEERERIFEPFYRGKGAKAVARNGAGLGLAIARSIARAHGGDVGVVSRAGERGSRFVIWLPCATE